MENEKERKLQVAQMEALISDEVHLRYCFGEKIITEQQFLKSMRELQIRRNYGPS